MVFQSKDWVKKCLLKRWIQLVVHSVFDTVGKLVLWDSCQAQIGQYVKSFMKNNGLISAVIPGGLTTFQFFKDKIYPFISDGNTQGQ